MRGVRLGLEKCGTILIEDRHLKSTFFFQNRIKVGSDRGVAHMRYLVVHFESFWYQKKSLVSREKAK